MFKLGIIGCGRIAEEGHAPALEELRNEVQVTALADSSRERLRVLGTRFNVPEGSRYTNYKRLLDAERLDIVDIALPHFLHEKAAVAAAQHKVNILIEKPLATSVKSAGRIVNAVNENGVIMCVFHNYRYNPVFMTALDLVKSGKIGTPFLLRMEGLGGGHYPGTAAYDPNWRTKMKRAGGGCLIDNGYHNIYLAQEMMGSPVVSVYARINTYTRQIDVDDTAALLMKHANNGTTSLQVSWGVTAGGQAVHELHGTEGSLFFYRDNKPVALFSNATKTFEYPELKSGSPNSFAGLMHDFFESLRTGSRPPTTGEEARQTLQIVMAAYKSGKTGKAVRLV